MNQKREKMNKPSLVKKSAQSVIKNPDYTEPVMAELDRMRQVSIRQFYKTDMYEGEKIESVLEWYDQIKKYIQTHPPEKPVKTVTV